MKKIKIVLFIVISFLLIYNIYAAEDISLNTPIDGENLSYGEDINFSWTYSGDYDIYILQVSSERNFTNLSVYEKLTSNTHTISSSNLKESTRYYFRVVAIKDNAIVARSDVNSFNL